MATPSIEAAEAMGATGSPPNEGERLAFEAWMKGHCWALCATWDGTGYRSDAEQGGGYCPQAGLTRRLWAAWRDRAALASPLGEPAEIEQQARNLLAAEYEQAGGSFEPLGQLMREGICDRHQEFAIRAIAAALRQQA